MTLLQEGNFKEILKTDEGNFVQNLLFIIIYYYYYFSKVAFQK